MEFKQKTVTASSKKQDYSRLINAIWMPLQEDYKELLEDYLHISRKRRKSTFSIYKLQLSILSDLLQHTKAIDSINKMLSNLEADSRSPKEAKEEQIKTYQNQIGAILIINQALKTIVDGMAWRYLNYNRAILSVLSNKEVSGPVRLDKGLITELFVFSEEILLGKKKAIINDISNFLRTGDITTIADNSDIELIEVKSSKKRGRRISRQKERLQEVVEFFNTGMTKFDGSKLTIMLSDVPLKNYLSILKKTIKKARKTCCHSELIGNYMILECVDFKKLDNVDKAIKYFDSRYESIKNRWEQNNDVVFPFNSLDRRGFSANLAPFSVFPLLTEDIIALMIGRIYLNYTINLTELIRMLEKDQWIIVETCLKSKAELLSFETPFAKIKKGRFNLEVPFADIAKVIYEMLNPKVLIDTYNELYNKGPQNSVSSLTNYAKEPSLWD
ncbi:MAG: hypothetical protein MRJ65_14015 [Candidatus Brocadiaceae bacterium]|nr:hypothetical protein [Candidatus Brocadiaceae bacterium]